MIKLNNKKNIVNLFPLTHDAKNTFIVGNKEGLLALRKAIDEALENNTSKCNLSPSDNDEFECNILMNNENVESLFWKSLNHPYPDIPNDTYNTYHPYDYLHYNILSSNDIPYLEEQKEKEFLKMQDTIDEAVDMMIKNQKDERK